MAADQTPMRSSGPIFLPVLGVLLVLGTTGCSRAGSLEVPRCPNPVLLGPVDRVGGHRVAEGAVTGRVSGDVVDYVPQPSAEDDALAGVLGSRASNDARALSVQVMNATGGRPDRDVRVERIEAGAFVMFVVPHIVMSHSTKLSAKVVEVRK